MKKEKKKVVKHTIAANLIRSYVIKESLKSLNTNDKLDMLRVLSKEALDDSQL